MAKIKTDLPNRASHAIVNELKRSSGLPVGDIADRLKMSYMGIKSQCLALEKSGHLTSRSQHVPNGRPRLIYRLTAKGQRLFQKDDCRLAISLLQEARKLFGSAAAEKLLFLHFQGQTADYLRQIPPEATPESRLATLATLREADGHMARIESGCLWESHAPLDRVFETFPVAVAMEETMISKLLGVPVTRVVETTGDHYQIRFEAFHCDPQVG